MSILLAVVLSISGSPSDGADAAPATVQTAPPVATARSGRELADAAHAALRKWAKATGQQADEAARDLLAIYRELQADTQLARSQRESLRITVRGRLDQLCTQITKRIANAKDKAIAKDGSKDAAKDAAIVTAKPAATVKSVAATNVARPMAQVGAQAGGGMAGTGQAGADDNGQQLVDLIQNTIVPKSWDVNGGNGSIYYWKQQHAIVVRATGDVQDEISDTIEQLDRASH